MSFSLAELTADVSVRNVSWATNERLGSDHDPHPHGVVFAIPPAVRLTELGIRQVDGEVIEAAHAVGSRPRQIRGRNPVFDTAHGGYHERQLDQRLDLR